MTKPKFSPGEPLQVCENPSCDNTGVLWLEQAMTPFIGKRVEFDTTEYYNGEWTYRTWIQEEKERCFWFNERWLEPVPTFPTIPNNRGLDLLWSSSDNGYWDYLRK